MLRTLSLMEWEIRSVFSLFSWLFLDPVAALCNGDDWRRYICRTEERSGYRGDRSEPNRGIKSTLDHENLLVPQLSQPSAYYVPIGCEDRIPTDSDAGTPRLSRGSSAPTDCVAVCGSRSAGSLLCRLRCAADRARQRLPHCRISVPSMSASLIGFSNRLSGSSTFRLSTAPASLSTSSWCSRSLG
jgi:hypothetical protein